VTKTIEVGNMNEKYSLLSPGFVWQKFTKASESYAMAQLVEALSYKPEDRRFDSRCVLLDFSAELWPWGLRSL
jgi:hypothetical protein